MPKKSQTLPIILSPTEVRQFLRCVPQRKLRTVLTVCYAAGLRISEAIALKPNDIIRIESRPREFHPKPLLEPCGTFACHTAPIVRTETFPWASQ